MQNLNFSIASDADIPDLEKLVNSAYRGDVSKKGWTTEAHLLDGIRTDEENLREMMGWSDAQFLKCTTSADELVGCVFLKKMEEKMYLGMLTVSPFQQANGIGKQLLNAAEKHALNHGCERIEMTVITDRTDLISWYERHGYVCTNETRPFPKDPRYGIPKKPLSFVVLTKQLQPENVTE